MRSLKRGLSYSNVCELFGLKLRRRSWYKISLAGDNDFWVIKFYGIDNDYLLHMGNAYVLRYDGFPYSYGCSNGIYHALCVLSEIEGIEKVSIDYVRGLDIDING